MGVGGTYKEKKKLEQIHVEEQRLEQQGNINKLQNKQSAHNTGENVLKSYIDSVSDTSQVQNQPRMDLRAVVTASNIHANVSAQKVLNGEELSAERQKKLQEDEQKIKDSVVEKEVLYSIMVEYRNRVERLRSYPAWNSNIQEEKEKPERYEEQLTYLLKVNGLTMEECEAYQKTLDEKKRAQLEEAKKYAQRLVDDGLVSEAEVRFWLEKDWSTIEAQKNVLEYFKQQKSRAEELCQKQFWVDRAEELKRKMASPDDEDDDWFERPYLEEDLKKTEEKIKLFGDAEKLEGELAREIVNSTSIGETLQSAQHQLTFVAKANALNLEDMTEESIAQREKERNDRGNIEAETRKKLEKQAEYYEERREEERKEEEKRKEAERQREEAEKQRKIEEEARMQQELKQREQEMKEMRIRAQEEAEKQREGEQIRRESKFYLKIWKLQKNFLENGDSSSVNYMAVYNKVIHMMNTFSEYQYSEEDMAEAYLDCYKEAVKYYNDHRGHRWSTSGKRRKNTVNELIRLLQQSLGSEILQVNVSDMVTEKMMSDTSETGFVSKKSREYFREKAREEASGADQVDEYSFKMVYYKRADQRRYKQMSNDFGMDAMQEVNRLSFDMAENYKLNLVGQPLTEKDAEIKERTKSFLKAVNGTPEQKQELFQKYAGEFLKVNPTPEMMTPEYVMDHWEQMRRISSESQWLVKAFSHIDLDTQESVHDFMHTLSGKDQQELKLRLKFFEDLPELMDALAETKNVVNDGYVARENRIPLSSVRNSARVKAICKKITRQRL